MELKFLNQDGQIGQSLAINEAIFAKDYNEALVHQVVVAYQANARLATRAQKTRAEVKHSTRKPWAQKGTGRARAGMTSSPIWRGGGRAFPNSPNENYSHKVNKKMYRAAMSAIYAQLVRENRLHAIASDVFAIDAPKTKLLSQKIKSMGLNTTVLIISDDISDDLYLASRNLHNVAILEPKHVSPLALVHFDKVLVTQAALAQIEELLK